MRLTQCLSVFPHAIAASQGTVLTGMLIVALLTTGCAGIRPYSEIRDKQATAALDAWKEVNLKAEMSAHRESLNALLQAEKSAQDDVGKSIRDFRLRVLMSDETMNDSLVKPLDQRMKRLNGGAMNQADLDEFRAKHENALVQIPRAQAAFKSAGLKVPDCGAFKRLTGWKDGDPLTIPVLIQEEADAVKDPGIQRELKLYLNELAVHCAYASLTTYVIGSAPADSALSDAWRQFQDDLSWVAADKDAADAAKQAYDAALSEYDYAVKDGTSDSEELNLTRIKDKLEDLKKLTGNPFAEKVVSEEKLKSLNDYLAAVTSYEPGEDFPVTASNAARATALIPELGVTIRSASASSKKPLVAPYLLMKNYEQLKLEAITRDVTARKQIAVASGTICEAMSAEILQLQDVQKLLNTNKLASRLGGKSVVAILKGGSGVSIEDKKQVLEASARYLDTIGRLESKRYKLEYDRIAAFHERTLAYSEMNAQQWENLISVSLSQLSEYGAGGLKREDMIGFLSALGIVWIGSGVN